MRKFIISLVLPLLFLAGTPSTSQAEGSLNLGSLVCIKGDNPFGKTYVLYSEQEMDA